MFLSMFAKKSCILMAIILFISTQVAAKEAVESEVTLTSVGLGASPSESEGEGDVETLKQKQFIASVINGIANMTENIGYTRTREAKGLITGETIGRIGDFEITTYTLLQDYKMLAHVIICRYGANVFVVHDYILITPIIDQSDGFPNWKDLPTEVGGIRIVSTDFVEEEGICKTSLSLRLGSTLSATWLSSQSKIALEKPLGHAGLIINAAGSEIKPMMAPNIYYKSGDTYRLLYGLDDGRDRDDGMQALVVWERTLTEALDNKRVSGTLVIIKATRMPDEESALVISEEDAKLIERVNKETRFLEEGKVIIVR